MRIIGGQWKRTPLPVADIEGLRPTPDRVRETTFNWLEHLLDRNWHGRACLDLFAGTGALGLEAASRGAARVVLIESHPVAVRQLQATLDKLAAAQVSVMRGDGLALLDTLPGKFDVIFLDPPYSLNLLPRLLPACRRLVLPGGLVDAESDQAMDAASAPEWLAGWEILRADKAGNVFFTLLKPDDKGLN